MPKPNGKKKLFFVHFRGFCGQKNQIKKAP